MADFNTSIFDFDFIPARRTGVVPERRDCRLAIVLHGKGDRLDAFSNIQAELGLFDFDFLILNGPAKFGDGFKWMNDEPRHHTSLAMVRDLLFALVEEIKESGYATENVLLLGHSQGGRVATDFVMHSPDTFLGVVAVSSYVGFFAGWADSIDDSDANGAWKTPWLFTHGTEDKIIPLREIRNDIAELSRAKIPLTYREFAKGHDFDYDLEMPYIRQWIRAQAPATRLRNRGLTSVSKSIEPTLNEHDHIDRLV